MVNSQRPDKPPTLPDGTGRFGAADAAMAELSRKLYERSARSGVATWRMVLDKEVRGAYAEADPGRLRLRLLQVAAVACAWVEDLENRGVSNG